MLTSAARPQTGFTLIEISIVLVVIGLIVGGILVGRDLIRAAELRGLVSTVEKIETSAHTFRLKYNCIPGDCATAPQFGLGDNGNGNQLLDAGWHEPFAFWAHLGNANLWAGSYSGLMGPGGYADCTLNVNCPRLNISGGTILMLPLHFREHDPNNGTWLLMMESHVLCIGADLGAFLNWPLNPFLTGTEAYQIDTKMDDGRPTTGKCTSATYAVDYAHTCEGDAVGSSTSITAANQPAYYRTDTNSPICSFMVKMPF